MIGKYYCAFDTPPSALKMKLKWVEMLALIFWSRYTIEKGAFMKYRLSIFDIVTATYRPILVGSTLMEASN